MNKILRISVPLLFSILSFSIAAPSAFAADTVVFSQTANLWGAYTGQHNTSVTPSTYFAPGDTASVYDNFTLSTTSSITSLGWTGDYYDGPPQPLCDGNGSCQANHLGEFPNTGAYGWGIADKGTVTGFTIKVYSDSIDQGTGLHKPNIGAGPIYTASISGNANETDLHMTDSEHVYYGPNEMYSYEAALAAPFQATGGTQYWLSIIAESAFAPEWGWETAGVVGLAHGEGRAYRQDQGDPTLKENISGGDFAFSLSSPTTVYVVKTGNDSNDGSVSNPLATIQAGINAVAPGGTVNVAAENYTEHLTINKSISLIGADKTTTFIDGTGSGTVVTITANNVVVKNFTIKNSGTVILENNGDNGGILTNGVTGGTIENNIFTNDLNSVLLLASSGVSVTNNTLTGSARYGIVLDFYPLESDTQGTTPSTSNTLSGNTITISGRDGIYFGKTSNNNTITGNNIISGTTGTDETDTTGNGFEGNGIYFWKSSGNTVTNNTISNNALGNGIEISAASNNTITGNTITGNLKGLLIRRTSIVPVGNAVNENKISGNTEYGLSTDILVSDTAINATNNWWGNASGPNYNSNGATGDKVSDYVTFSPYYISDAMNTTSDDVAAVDAINNAADESAMATAVTTYASTLGLAVTDPSDYFSLVNRVPVQTALLSPVFANKTEVKTAFDTAVGTQKATEASKTITAFGFAELGTGNINEGNRTIAVEVPFGTSVTALVATFGTSGASVKVGDTAQTSGATTNDFTGAVVYRVTAINGTYQDYTVTVTHGADPVAVAFDSISSTLILLGIVNNLDTVDSTNEMNFHGLFFEKEGLGRITFNNDSNGNGLDLSDPATQTYLSGLQSKLGMTGGKIGLNAIGSALAGKSASVKFYGTNSLGIPDIATADQISNLIVVRDDSNAIISKGNLVTNPVFTGACEVGKPECQTFSFDVGHFTSFELDTMPPDAPVISSIATDNKINDVEKGAIVVTGTAEANSTINVSLTSGVTVSGTGTTDGSGNYSVTLNGVALTDGTVTPSVTATDAVGNTSAPTATPTATKDVVTPNLASVAIASNNANTTLAKAGDVVTLSFVSDENIGTPVVTIATQSAAVSGGPTSWTATYTMTSNEATGAVPFHIVFSDLAGNASTAVTAVIGNTSSVTFDKTPPTLTIYTVLPQTIISPNASVGVKDSTDVDIAFSEPVHNADLNIKDASGNLVKTLHHWANSEFVTNPNSYPWNGTNTGGAFVADGVYTIEIIATDAAGNPLTDTSKTITVDNTAPVITIPQSTTAEATSASGAVVTYTAPSAVDATDGSVATTCNHNSGNTFPLGVTTITCNASDTAGNAANPSTFTVTVHDTTGPIITAHADVSAESAAGTSIAVTYTSPSTSDAVNGASTASCTPSSGTTFAMGNTTVTCNKSDTAGNSATATHFIVHVADTTAPTAPVISTTAQSVNTDTINITGTAESNTTVTVTGGAGTATGTATSGYYNISVTLTHNTVNNLSVTAKDASNNVSSPTTVAVTHDDISSAPANLVVGSPTLTTLALSWTNGENNGSYYTIKRSTSEITADNFDATPFLSSGPTVALGAQGFTAKNLTAGTTYYFAIEMTDAVGNISNIATTTGTTASAGAPASSDVTAPTAVTNLSLSAGPTATSQIVLNWSATGDDGSTGIATKYVIKRSLSAITADNFDSATTVFNSISPSASSSPETLTVSGLTANTTYYFAIKVQDEVPNTSTISNVEYATTANNLPTVTSVSPTTNQNDSSASITVTGTNFAAGATTVRFTSSANTFDLIGSYESATQVTATVAIGIPAGVYGVRVIDANGTSAVYASAYTVTSAPTPIPFPSVTDVVPSNIGNNDADVNIEIYGTGFTGVSSTGVILNDGGDGNTTLTNVVAVSDTKITATISGTLSAGIYNVKVTNATGTNSVSAVQIKVTAPVVIDSGDTKDVVTDKPINMDTDTIPVQITMQSSTEDSTLDNNTTIEVVISPDTVLTDDSGKAYTGNINPPQLVKPTEEIAAQAGDNVVVITMGNPNETINFSQNFVTTVTLESTNGVAPLIWYYNPSAGLTLAGITGTKDGVDYIPGGTLLNTVDNGNGTYTYTIGLLLDHMSSYVAGVTPTISSISPTSGVVGTSVIVTGTNFSPGAVVKFGSTVASVTANSVTQLTATAPSLSVGSYGITVTNTDALAATSPTNFTVTVVSNGGGGGGGNLCGNGFVWNSSKMGCSQAVTTVVTPAPAQGQVLGAAVYNFAKNLTIGSRGADVTALQQFLIDSGYAIPAGATGFYGVQTKTAVLAFQKAKGIAQVGAVGPLTRAELNKGSSSASITSAQANSIAAVLQAFGADEAIINKVRAALAK